MVTAMLLKKQLLQKKLVVLVGILMGALQDPKLLASHLGQLCIPLLCRRMCPLSADRLWRIIKLWICASRGTLDLCELT